MAGTASDVYVRADTGIDEGGEISMHYDPMIAKLVTYAPTRDAAIDAMQDAIDRYRIAGVSHNLPFLSALFAHPALRAGDLTTRFIEDHFPDGFDSATHEAEAAGHLPTIAAWLERRASARDRADAGAPTVARSSATASVAAAAGHDVPAAGALAVFEGESRTDVSGETMDAIESDWTPGEATFLGTVDGASLRVGVDRIRGGWLLNHRGSRRTYRVVEPHVAELVALMPVKAETDLSKFLLSPMPGLLTKVMVAEGDEVVAGQELAVIEAMKMENTLRAVKGGTVKAVVAGAGESLAVDAVIVEFE